MIRAFSERRARACGSVGMGTARYAQKGGSARPCLWLSRKCTKKSTSVCISARPVLACLLGANRSTDAAALALALQLQGAAAAAPSVPRTVGNGRRPFVKIQHAAH